MSVALIIYPGAECQSLAAVARAKAVIATSAAIELNRYPGATMCGTEVIETRETGDYRERTDALDLTGAPHCVDGLTDGF